VASILSFPSDLISQEELEVMIGLANQLRTLNKLYAKRAGELLLRLQAGAAVEYGVHTAEIEDFWDKKGQRIQRLEIH
jgi:hypothetical protein